MKGRILFGCPRATSTPSGSRASHGDPAALATLEADPHRWRQFLDQETRACAEPGTAAAAAPTACSPTTPTVE